MTSKKKYSKIPYKEIGNGTLSSGIFLSSYMLGGLGLGVSALLGGACYLGYRLLIGTDASRDDMWKDIDAATKKRAIKRIEAAKSHMVKIGNINKQIPSAKLTKKITELETTGLAIIDLFELDPKDINRSKRFIEVYLEGAVSVSQKYADINQHLDDEAIYRQYESFLDEMVNAFQKQHRGLLDDDMLDLDVEIEVLTNRLKTEHYNK